jgi:hypothetical protein
VRLRTNFRNFPAVLEITLRITDRLPVPKTAATLLALCCALAAAAPSPARPEIDALLARLQASGCSFNRNGTWYGAADARKHLLRKLEYLEDRDLVRTSEQFIERAGSGSSMSGKPYLVRCGGAAPVESRVWLGNELKALRAGR